MAVGREVHFVQGRADLVLYKSNEEALLSDSVIEFKVARQGENVLKKLAAGAKQIVDKRYGISYKNPILCATALYLEMISGKLEPSVL